MDSQVPNKVVYEALLNSVIKLPGLDEEIVNIRCEKTYKSSRFDVYIETEKRKYPLVFNLNVMEEIQEQYGSLDEWGRITQGTGEAKVKDLKVGILAMINEAIDMQNEENNTNEPMLTAKQVGRIMTEVGIDKIVAAIQDITIASTKGEDNGKNE